MTAPMPPAPIPALRLLSVLALLPLLSPPLEGAENWPGWRGPRGDGSTADAGLPVRWSPAEDLRWKTPIPGKGHSSPIVWEDRIYLTSALADSAERVLLCLDRASGAIRWRKPVLRSPFEDLHRLNSHASGTPATDGERIYLTFLDRTDMFVAACDMEGNRLWEARPGLFSSKHGYCSCPVLWKDKVIVNGDHDGDAYLVALNRETGAVMWKTDRPNKTRSYCTPIIREIAGRHEMILSGSKSVAAYDPDTGRQLWVIDGPTEQFVASLVYHPEENLLFMTCGFPEKHLLAIRPGGNGNVTGTHIAWRETAGASYVPSPVVVGPYFLVVADNGVASCFVARSGERLWRERLNPEGQPGGHSASPITDGRQAWFLSDAGTLTVVKPGPSLEILSQVPLGEPASASPVPHDGALLIRGESHLFCIGGRR